MTILRAVSPAETIAQRRGLVTIIVLGVLTALEYAAAIGIDSTQLVVVLLSLAALAKAAAIVWIFMHVAKLWRGEDDHV